MHPHDMGHAPARKHEKERRDGSRAATLTDPKRSYAAKQATKRRKAQRAAKYSHR